METGIGKRVFAAVERMDKEDAEGALHDICSAIEATAKKETGKGGRGYKEFIHNNLDVITKVALGASVLNIRLGFQHPQVKMDSDGTTSIQEILYHVVRCGLYHEGCLPSNLIFGKEQIFRADNGHVTLPGSLVHGLIVAVVTSPANANEKFENGGIQLHGIQIAFSSLRGKKQELLTLYTALDQVTNALRPFERRTAP